MICAPSEVALPAGRLRRFVPEDINAFAALNADPRVMELFPHPWSFRESKAASERAHAGFSELGLGVYALENMGEFRGILELSVPSFQAHFTPCVEIVWRLDPKLWGQGLVATAAREVLSMSFRTLKLTEVFAFAVIENQRSIRVMERIGMEQDPEPFFDHQQSQRIGCGVILTFGLACLPKPLNEIHFPFSHWFAPWCKV